MDYISSLWRSSSQSSQSTQDELLFRSATEQLSPEDNGFPTNPTPAQFQTFRVPPQLQNPDANVSQAQLARRQEIKEDIAKGLVSDKPRTHFDSIMEEKDFQYDPTKGHPRLVRETDVRSNLDLKTYFDRVMMFFEKTYPRTSIPNLNFNIVPRPGNPFLCATERNECQITPLAIAQNGPMVRKIFRALTPTFQESQRKLLDVSDALYYSPERVQFNIAKALCEAAAGSSATWTLIKLQFLRFSPDKYSIALAKKEMESDGMAARLSADIALGGLEHVIKLHHYRLVYQHDLKLEDPGTVADKRFLNLLDIVKEKYDLGPSEAVKLALNPRAFISEDPSKVYSAAENIIETENARQQKLIERLELQQRLQQEKSI